MHSLIAKLVMQVIIALWEQTYKMVICAHLARIVQTVLVCQHNVLLASII